MARSDELRIQDMFEAASDIGRFIEHRTRKDLNEDLMFARALVATIQIIGEAAKNVSAPSRAKYSDIEWDEASGMRNHLIHGYFDIDNDILWDTVNFDVPRLRQKLELIISQPGLGI